MERTKNAHPLTQKSIPGEAYYSRYDTIVVLGLQQEQMRALAELSLPRQFKICTATELADLFAIPCFYTIIDPIALTDDDIETLLSIWEEINEKSVKKVFTRHLTLDIPRSLQQTVISNPKIFDNITNLKLELLKHQALLTKKCRVAKEYESRLVRILGILKRLKQKRLVNAAELAMEFHVSARTIQRDIITLEHIGEAIGYNSKSKAYFLLCTESLLWEE